MAKNCFAFIDTETTGTNFLEDRIIEISILRVENNKLTRTFTTLLNPEMSISPFTTEITGIQIQDLSNAPTFFDVKSEIEDILKDCTFVAHNVRFDYGFVKTEFKRLGKNFHSKTLDTVKLSRAFFPDHFHHNLDSIIERFGFECLHRHRAFDDAKVLVDFYQYLHQKFSAKKLNSVITKLQKRTSLPPGLDQDTFVYLPETPGVYMFYDENSVPLYIGKSINIRERVLSHFHKSSSSPSELSLINQIKNIKTFDSAGDLNASILESQLIKTLKPIYNRQLRQNNQIVILKKIITQNNYLGVEIDTVKEILIEDMPNILATFKSKKQAKTFLENVAKEYNLCAKLLNLEKTSQACFLNHLGICHGACLNQEHYLKYNLRFLEAFSHKKFQKWPFDYPIVITETNPINGLTEKLVFDNWCLLMSVKTDGYHESENSYIDLQFDLDIYKILKRFLSKTKNYQKIQKFQKTDNESFRLNY